VVLHAPIDPSVFAAWLGRVPALQIDGVKCAGVDDLCNPLIGCKVCIAQCHVDRAVTEYVTHGVEGTARCTKQERNGGAGRASESSGFELVSVCATMRP